MGKNKKNIKKWLTLSLPTLLVAGIVFWLVTSLGGPSPKNTPPLDKITIANVGEYSIFNVIAQEQGIFRRHGLEVALNEFASGPLSIAELVAGRADFAVAAEFVGVTNVFKNHDLRILSQASRHEVFELIALRSKGISSPSDLKGKRVGVTKKTAGEFFLGRYLTLVDLTPSEVAIVDLRPSEIQSKLEDGDIDAAVIFEPHAYAIQKKIGANALMWSSQGGHKTFAIVYSRDSFVRNNSSVVDRYMAALKESEDYVRSRPSEAKAIIARNLGYGLDYLDYVWPKFDFTLSLDQELLLTMEDEARWAIENGLTDATDVPNYLQSIFFDPLEKIKPESITIIH